MTDTAIPEGRLWYYSDDEETWFGNCASREDAVDEGRDAHPDRPFTICEARAIPKDPDEDPEDWLYALVDMRHEETIEPLEGEEGK